MRVCVKHCYLCSEIDIAYRHDLLETLWVHVTSFDVSYCVCVCYHPPQPFYHASIITELLHNNLQQLTDQFPTNIIVLAGDLNKLG
jgi:hypothetical protein